MDYTFSLSKTKLIIIVVGFFLLGSLLFSAGLVIGLYTDTPANTISSASSSINNLISTPAPTVISTPAPAIAATQTKANNNVGKNDSIAPETKSSETKPLETKSAETATATTTDNSMQSRNSDKKKGFVVQVGNFAELPEAQLLLYQLELKGYIPRISEVRDAQRRVRYVVLLGSYLYEADAKKSAALFSEQERVNAEAMLMNLF